MRRNNFSLNFFFFRYLCHNEPNHTAGLIFEPDFNFIIWKEDSWKVSLSVKHAAN